MYESTSTSKVHKVTQFVASYQLHTTQDMDLNFSLCFAVLLFSIASAQDRSWPASSTPDNSECLTHLDTSAHAQTA